MTGEAIPFGVCLTGLQGLQGPLGWEPAAEVTVARDASSCLPRDGADVNAAANTVAGCAPPHNFLILDLGIAYYGAFWRHVANILTLQTTYTMNFNDTHTRVHCSLTGP